MGSVRVGDGEDERMVAIVECVSDGVVVCCLLVVGIGDWLVVLILVLVVVCWLFVVRTDEFVW